MKTYCFVPVFFLCLMGKICAPNPVWSKAKSIGGVGNDGGNVITSDINGNVYTLGNFNDTVDFDPGPGTFNLLQSPQFISVQYFSPRWIQLVIFADANGSVYFTGMFEDPIIRFGNGSLFNHTPDTLLFTDAFIAKLASPTTGLNGEVSITKQLHLYPNPSIGIFYLEENHGLQQISVFNFTGELVYDEKLDSFGLTKMNLSFLENVVYLYKIMMKDGSFNTGKICIQK